VLRHYARVISILLREYENKKHGFGRASHAEMLSFLMEQNNLKQEDLKNDLGGQPAVSNILSGKRKINRKQIERLYARFGLNPSVFFPKAE
jgi:HTH-type transcriptional regulator/antitoxin HigA